MNPDDVLFSEQDQRFMRRALDLAHGAMYRTSPNPRVGCVLVRDGQVLGEGATLAAGQTMPKSRR